MGMYTDLVMGVEISADPKVIQKLRYMLDNSEPDININHKLFTDKTRWKFMLHCDSYYFDGQTDSKLIYDECVENYYLNVRCNLKNYDNEIELFLNWLCPYIKTEGFLGYMRYEEDYNPTLIYKEKGKIVFRRLKEGDKEWS